jgi:hypothetical protein
LNVAARFDIWRKLKRFMRKDRVRARVTVFVGLAIAIAAVCSFPSAAQTSSSNQPLFGTWKLDPARSSLKRGGPQATNRPLRQATWVFSAEGDGFRMSEYNGDDTSAKPTLTYTAKFDGKEYSHQGGRDKGETVTHWQISPNIILREARVDGRPTEWVVWAVSSDDNVLTSTSWDPGTPEYQNVRVFDRQK